MLTKQGPKKPKSISKQKILISKLISMRIHRICTQIGFLLSRQLFLSFGTAVSAADLLELQDDCSIILNIIDFDARAYV